MTLHLEDMRVLSAELHQLVVRAAFRYPAVFKVNYPIAEAGGGKAMRDIDRGLVGGQLVIFHVERILRYRVKRGGRLVENDDRSILIERTGKHQLLPLTAGHVYRVVENALHKP